MPRLRVDTEMLEGITVEWLEVESIDVLATWAERSLAILRKNAPLNRLLPYTLLWAKELPSQILPVALMDKFPRIANLIAANWKERAAFDAYMQGLLVDRRGSRQGFPSEIKEELVRLRTYYYLGSLQHCSDVGGTVAPNSVSMLPGSGEVSN